MSLTVGELYAELKLNRGEFEHGLSKAHGSLLGFGKAALAIGAVVAGILAVAIKKAVGSTEAYYVASKRVAAITGLNITEASRLVSVFQRFGLEGDGVIKTIGMLTKNVGLLTSNVKNEAKFEKTWGFSLRDASGHVKRADALILQAADYFTNKHIPATKKAALESKLFGKNWQNIVPILSLGSKGILEAEAAADKLGITLTAENAESLAKYRESTIKLGEAWAGVKVQLALLVIPALTDVANVVSEHVIPSIMDAVKWVKRWVDGHLPLIHRIAHVIGLVERLTGLVRDQLVTSLKHLVTKLGEVYQAFEPVIDGLALMTSKAFVDGLKLINDAISSLGENTGAILAIAAAVLVLNAALRANPIIAIISLIITALGFLKEAWDSDFGGIREIVDGVYKAVQPILEAIAGLLGGDGVAGAAGALSGVMTTLGEIWSAVVQSLSDAWTIVQPVLVDGIAAVGGIIDWLTTNVLPSLQVIFGVFTDTIIPLFVSAFKGIADWVVANWPLISEVIGKAAKLIGDAFHFVMDTLAVLLAVFAQVFKAIWDVMGPVVQWMMDTFGPILGALFTAFLQILNGVLDGVSTVFTAIWTVIKQVVDDITGMFHDFQLGVQVVWDAVTGIVKGAIDFIVGVVNGFIGAIKGAIDWVKNLLGLQDDAAKKQGELVTPTSGGSSGTYPHLAAGTPYWPGGMAVLGEVGPELVNLPRGSRVTPSSRTRDMLAAGGAAGGVTNINLTVQGDLTARDEPSVLRTLQRMQEVAG